MNKDLYHIILIALWLTFIFGLCALFSSVEPLWLLIVMCMCW